MIQETKEVQLAGTLDESAMGSLVKLMRESNVTLHWILLHTTTPTIALEDSKRSRTLCQLVITESKYTAVNCLRLLLSTAQIEQDVKQMYKDVRFRLFASSTRAILCTRYMICHYVISCCLEKRPSGLKISKRA